MSRRILFVTSRPPWPPINGGFQRSYLLYRSLAQLGSVDLVLVGFQRSEEQLAELQSSFRLVGYWLGNPSLRQRLGQVLSLSAGGRLRHRYDALPDAICSLREKFANGGYDVVVARYLESLCRTKLWDWSPCPVLLDVDDLDHARRLSMLNGPSVRLSDRLMARMEAQWMQQLLTKVSSRLAHVWLTKEEDAEAIPHQRVSVLENAPFIEDSEADIGPVPYDSKVVVFVGNLSYKVNVRALDHFTKRIWPKVRYLHPEAMFHIVGSGGRQADLRRWNKVSGVRCLGFVENIADAYRDAAFSVCPIDEGAGTKIKALESLRLGRPVVITTHSLRGLEQALVHRKNVLVAKNEDVLIQHCMTLLSNPALRQRLADHGKAVVSERYSPHSFIGKVRTDVFRCIENNAETPKPPLSSV